MPYIPVVTIALHLIIRTLEGCVRRSGTWPIGMVRIFHLKQSGQQVMEHAVVAILETLVERVIGFVPAPVAPALFHFVVAAPDR